MYRKLTFLSLFLAIFLFYFNLESTTVLNFFRRIITPNAENSDPKAFTKDALKLYNGISKPELYLAILGKIFDVTKGATHYGPGKTYNFFIGKDASRSFVTGKFGENDATDHVSDLSNADLRSLNHWVKFYGKEYKRVGKLIGRYYQPDGKLTRYGREIKRLIKKADEEQTAQDLEKVKYPPCNVEWDAESGSRVWCTNRSGGIQRDWDGVPRQMYEPGSKNYRCACVQPDQDLGTQFKQYEGCDSNASSCFVK